MNEKEVIAIVRKAKEEGLVMENERVKLGEMTTPTTEKIKIILQLKDRLEKLEQIRKKMEEHPEDWEL